MSRLPVIVAMGGINPAGRVSGHHAYRRMVINALPLAEQNETYRSLATLMGVNGAHTDPSVQAYIREHTLVRRIEHFDLNDIPLQRSARIRPVDGQLTQFTLRKRDMPDHIPESWIVEEQDEQRMLVTVVAETDILVPDSRTSKVSSAGQLPTGFKPEDQYPSRSHPRGLQLTIWGASDAIRSVGIDWARIRNTVGPDEIACYSGSAMGQMDFDGNAGLLQSHLLGKRVTAKQVALALAEMPADFINAYVLGSVGCTGANIGACATFLYNLRLAADDIRSGRRRVVVVGNAEAPILPEIIEGYRTMGALAEDDALMALDGRNDTPDCRRAVRPFSDNCGFTLAEAGVFTVLFDDELAVELGANVMGSVADVFVNADGYKKSIPGPGIGNYLTMAKALALAESIVGKDALRTRTMVQAHGTSTPQNRVTESHILSHLAGIFGIDNWIVGACKAYLGHTLAPAGADQLATILGTWAHGWVPGIATIDHIAADVHTKHLRFSSEHIEVGRQGLDAALINSKGFGGNNATALILAPHVTRKMLAKRHGTAAMQNHARRNVEVEAASAAYDQQMSAVLLAPIYKFGEGVVDGSELRIDRSKVSIPGFEHSVSLELANPFADMMD